MKIQTDKGIYCGTGDGKSRGSALTEAIPASLEGLPGNLSLVARSMARAIAAKMSGEEEFACRKLQGSPFHTGQGCRARISRPETWSASPLPLNR